jgi:hypothetical protein
MGKCSNSIGTAIIRKKCLFLQAKLYNDENLKKNGFSSIRISSHQGGGGNVQNNPKKHKSNLRLFLGVLRHDEQKRSIYTTEVENVREKPRNRVK